MKTVELQKRIRLEILKRHLPPVKLDEEGRQAYISMPKVLWSFPIGPLSCWFYRRLSHFFNGIFTSLEIVCDACGFTEARRDE
mgnify:CR=1 FL=1